MGSSHFGTFIISPKVLTHQQILLTSCRESVRKGLRAAHAVLLRERGGSGTRLAAELTVCGLSDGARRIRTRSPTVGFAVGRAAPEKIAISAKESPSLFEGDQRFESAFLQRGVQQTSTSFITSAPAVS